MEALPFVLLALATDEPLWLFFALCVWMLNDD